jgi:ribosomal protein S18 acetylase RimI-like enzyme
MKIAPAEAEDAAETTALWAACGLTRPWNDPLKDFNFALNSSASAVLVGRDEGGRIIASVMVGHDGHRGALYYLAVSPDHQGQGLGRAIHDAAIDWLRQRSVWKLNLLVRTDNLKVQAFYEALGYTQNQAVSFAKAIA